MNKQGKKRYFIDIDGTLAVYISKDYAWWEIDGIFRHLTPQRNVLNAIKELINNKEEVYIITAYHRHTPLAKYDKIYWLKKHLPEVDINHQIYTFCGEDKTTYIPNGVKPTDILLDDFNKNLENWRNVGGTSIKLLNGLNSKTSWNGKAIEVQETSENIYNALRNTSIEETILH